MCRVDLKTEVLIFRLCCDCGSCVTAIGIWGPEWTFPCLVYQILDMISGFRLDFSVLGYYGLLRYGLCRKCHKVSGEVCRSML